MEASPFFVALAVQRLMRGAAAEPMNLLLNCGLQFVEQGLNSLVRCVSNLSTEAADYIVRRRLGIKRRLGKNPRFD